MEIPIYIYFNTIVKFEVYRAMHKAFVIPPLTKLIP